MVVVAWPFAFIGLVAPAWMIPVMLAAWAAMLVVALRNFDRRPMLVLVMPVIALAVWVARRVGRRRMVRLDGLTRPRLAGRRFPKKGTVWDTDAACRPQVAARFPKKGTI